MGLWSEIIETIADYLFTIPTTAVFAGMVLGIVTGLIARWIFKKKERMK